MGAKLQVSALFVFLLLGFSANAEEFDVRNYGYVSAGSDITQALLKAFGGACKAARRSRVVIPKGEYRLGKVELAGPCKSKVEVSLQGTVKANGNTAKGEDRWVVFSNMDGFLLTGGGVFDGQGKPTWSVNDCRQTKNCTKHQTSIRFNSITNGVVRYITSKDAKNFHMSVRGCKNLTIEHVKITLPEDIPNTDGILLGGSNNIKIINSFISSGDDCISIGDGINNLHVEGVTCVRHGISVGSLGRSIKEQPVAGITFKNCTLQETDNGLRIKTWPSSNSSITVSGIHFQDIIVNKVTNPILINQEYCPWGQCNRNKPSTVKLRNISFKNIRGTSANKDAVRLFCSEAEPCQNVEIGNIDLKYDGADGPATFACSSVTPTLSGTQNPKACSSPMRKPIDDH